MCVYLLTMNIRNQFRTCGRKAQPKLVVKQTAKAAPIPLRVWNSYLTALKTKEPLCGSGSFVLYLVWIKRISHGYL
ncbi:hypothetical protein CLV24_103284 [Pontibacter ummariensis]|uniref:Uncharacterized protein n=1 Tax=Pontibacter ummariensis TaxID=1610492 RepID=A0A239CFH6_9BACT|nr:hypothetical protein CLV24_103284 [Pontibacter ummariensis]SNS18860.1 hypothetical protein SAMN06296052_10329 [Pontibacter ummariensis]